MDSYVSYILDNIKSIGVYGLIIFVAIYLIYKFKQTYDDNKLLNEQIDKQNKDIETQKKIINAIQNNKPRTLSDNFKRMRSEK
jgi:Co/Zn/Cd efflux system component